MALRIGEVLSEFVGGTSGETASGGGVGSAREDSSEREERLDALVERVVERVLERLYSEWKE